MMMIHKSSDKQIRLREFSSTDLSEKLLVLVDLCRQVVVISSLQKFGFISLRTT
jgi:hypothetical protein